MILFKKDYSRYKNLHIHVETKNESFLKIASLYKEMGIENWAFPLVLHQKELIDVNPFSENLDNETAIKIALEAKFNPWYTFREIIRIPVQGSAESSQFFANRANIALFWCFFNHLDFLMIQPRQTYKSGSVDSLMVLLLFIAGENLNINLVTKDGSLRNDNVERLKGIRDNLPFYFYRDNGEDVNNKVAVTNYLLNNKYKTSVSQKSVVGANKVGRGATGSVFHLDEFGFISHLAITLPSALSAGTEARNQAKKRGSFYGNIFTTTSGDREDRDGEYAYRIMDSATVWSEHFFDCKDRKSLFEMVRLNRNSTEEFKNSTLINGTFSYRQLGRSKEWLIESMANSRGDREQTERDYLNKWTTGSSYSPLDQATNERIFNSEKEPCFTEVVEGKYLLRWYCEESERENYLENNSFVLGLDASEAIGNDAVGIVLSDIRDLRTVMSTNITESNLLTFAYWLSRLLIRYKNITLIPEMSSTARVIVDVLLIEFSGVGIDPYVRIFNHLIDDNEKYNKHIKELNRPLQHRGKDFVTVHRKELGYKPTKESRIYLFKNNLQLAASRTGHLVYDQVLSKEIRGLVVKNGRVDHVASGNDDVCVAWLLNHWFLTNGRNLNKYGIKKGTALSMVSEDSKSLGVSEEKELKAQFDLRADIDKLVDELSTAEDIVLIAKLRNDIKRLSKKIEEKDVAIYNFDDLMKRANDMRIKRQKEERLKKRRNKFKSGRH